MPVAMLAETRREQESFPPVAEAAAAINVEAEAAGSKHDRSPPESFPYARGDPAALPWHHWTGAQTIACLESDEAGGLSGDEARQRLALYGSNELAQAVKPSWVKLFLAQFDGYLVRLLLGAAGLSIILGRMIDAFTTLSIVIVNALVGALQERKK